ncbi:MAG: dienelactone hydrolase family protein [Panacagrimonas sp.]
MTHTTFKSAGDSYKITINPAPADGKKYPMIFLVHGNFGLSREYGTQIKSFAEDLAKLDYLTAVPQYYLDDKPHFFDQVPHDQTLADAITAVAARADADSTRVGLIGFSLGAATAMAYIAIRPAGAVKVLADFFGPLPEAITGKVSRFPPTIILHNKQDEIVKIKHSEELDRLLQKEKIEHQFVGPYDEYWKGVNHAFEPGGAADTDSRSKTKA